MNIIGTLPEEHQAQQFISALLERATFTAKKEHKIKER
jgi:hypothetical protein